MKTKILVITGSLSCGGTEKITSTICNYLASKGEIVFLGLVYKHQHYYKIDERVQILELGLNGVKIPQLKVYSFIKKMKPDVLFSTLSPVNTIISNILWLLPKSMYSVGRLSGMPSWYIAGVKNKFHEKISHHYFFRGFNRLISQSEVMKDEMVHLFNYPSSKIEVIYNPASIVVNHIPPKNDVPLFITVGNLRKVKGYLRILKALHNCSIKYRYVILGDGPLRKDIENFIDAHKMSNSVELLGRKHNPLEYLKQADFYLCGSYYEGFSNSILEALSIGLPVLGFNIPGISEVITHNFNGILVENGDISEFTRQIDLISKQRFNHQSIQEAVVDKFSYQKIMDKYHQLLTIRN